VTLRSQQRRRSPAADARSWLRATSAIATATQRLLERSSAEAAAQSVAMCLGSGALVRAAAARAVRGSQHADVRGAPAARRSGSAGEEMGEMVKACGPRPGQSP